MNATQNRDPRYLELWKAIHWVVGLALRIALSSSGKPTEIGSAGVGTGVAPELGLACKMAKQARGTSGGEGAERGRKGGNC